MLGLVGVLRDRQAAALLDALDADRAVAVGAGQHDRRRVRAVRVGQRAEEQVDRDAPAALRWQVGQLQVAVGRRESLPGGMT